jgi:hypothetical protein
MSDKHHGLSLTTCKTLLDDDATGGRPAGAEILLFHDEGVCVTVFHGLK